MSAPKAQYPLLNNSKCFSHMFVPQHLTLKQHAMMKEPSKEIEVNPLAMALANTPTPFNVAYASPSQSLLSTSTPILQNFPAIEALVSYGLHKYHSILLHTPTQAQKFEFEEEEDEIEEFQGKWWHSTLSGVVGGVCCVYAGQPFDTLKVRLQTQSPTAKIYRGPLDCFRKTVTQEGYKTLYKGSSAALASVILENAVLFTANSTIKNFMATWSNSDMELSLAQEALAGGLSGFFSSTAITPAEVIKCRLQAQERAIPGMNSSLYKGPIDCLTKTIRREGLKGLFTGLPSVWARDIPFNFVFLGSYEGYCSLFASAKGTTRDNLSPANLFMSGGLAGVTGWSIIFPMDAVKSKIQTSKVKVSAMQVIKQTMATQGIKGFYQGWSAAVMRAFPANAALLLGVEMSKKILSDHF